MSTPTWAHWLASFVAAAWFSAQAASCARDDIVLGERGGMIGTPWMGSAGADEAAGSPADTVPVGQAGDAANGVGGAGGPAPQAGAPAAGNTSGSAADASPARTVARPNSGCGKDPAAAGSTIEVYGMRASYLVALPVAYDRSRAYPLVVAFRSTGVTIEQFSRTLNLSSVTGSDAMVVYPNPLTEPAAWEYTRDMPMFNALLPKLKSEFCVDEDRVFALGDGAGALFANLVGCVNADEVRAIALFSGAPPPPGPCLGNAAVWLVQSTRDTSTLGASKGNRDYWVGRNKCELRRFMSVAPEPCVEYAGCDPRTPVRYCEHDSDELPSFAASGAWDFFKSL